jgi:hypothetical protein
MSGLLPPAFLYFFKTSALGVAIAADFARMVAEDIFAVGA